MSDIIVKLADLVASNNAQDTLVVYGLGSTTAVVLYDEVAKVGGIAHYVLPRSASKTGPSDGYPAMYADVGIPLLVESCKQLGASVGSLSARVAGGALLLEKGKCYNIGEGNVSAARKILSELGIKVIAEHVGGNHNRSLRLDIPTGKISIRHPGGTWEELR
jgi:chemotaxis protein CheD